MQQFIKLFILFIFILTTLMVVSIQGLELIVDKESDFKLDSNPKYLVLGHSHPACAFNDSIIKNLKNLSYPRESYFYTYFKTQKTLEQNPSIEVVFIEFTNNQIDSTMNDWIWGDENIGFFYSTYSPFMGISDKMLLAENNISGYYNAVSLSFKHNLLRLIKRDFLYRREIGGYWYLNKNETDSLAGLIKENNFPIHKNEISQTNLNWLSKLIKYCKEKHKRVILIRSPQHEKYSEFPNETIYQEIRKKDFSSTEYLDFSKFPLPNSEFGDLDHLNYKGAIIFSNWFAHLLSENILEKDNKQAFIDEEINARRHNN